MSNNTLSEELAWRGFINQTTLDSPQELDNTSLTFYLGVDPSSDSMTIGNLAMIMMVRHFVTHGHKAILLVGGATGMIGDPDGKVEERKLQTREDIERNKKGITGQYRTILADLPFEVVDNYEWFKHINYLDFLRDIGKHVPMSQMLGREFVQSRLGEDGAGISYAEFSYALIQGYDFLHLFREKGVVLQVCGADQWGNSIAGVELIRRIEGKEAHVWSAPLVINKATGRKFGKSEGGAVWLNAEKTSPYAFYQFWLNVDDDGAEDYLKIYTLLSREEIEAIVLQFNENRGNRLAQKTLAYEVTKLVHGQDIADSIVRVTNTLFGGADYMQLEERDLEILLAQLPSVEAKLGDGLIESLVAAGAAASNSEARRLLMQNAVYINGQSVGIDTVFEPEYCIASRFAIVRKGKNFNFVVQLGS